MKTYVKTLRNSALSFCASVLKLTICAVAILAALSVIEQVVMLLDDLQWEAMKNER